MKKTKQMALSVALTAAMALSCAPCYALSSVNATTAHDKAGNTLFAVRSTLSAFGVKVSYVAETGEVQLERNGEYARFADGDTEMKVGIIAGKDGKTYCQTGTEPLSTPVQIVDDTAYAPQDVITKFMRYHVETDGGKMTVQAPGEADGMIYYASWSDYGHLYSMDSNGQNRKKLSDHDCYDIQYIDGYLYYYIRGDKHQLYRMKPDGTGETCLTPDEDIYDCSLGGEKYAEKHGIDSQKIYYYSYASKEGYGDWYGDNDKTHASFRSMNRDGSDKKTIIPEGRISNILAHDGKYYFIEKEDNLSYLKMVDAEGGEITTINPDAGMPEEHIWLVTTYPQESRLMVMASDDEYISQDEKSTYYFVEYDGTNFHKGEYKEKRDADINECMERIDEWCDDKYEMYRYYKYTYTDDDGTGNIKESVHQTYVKPTGADDSELRLVWDEEVNGPRIGDAMYYLSEDNVILARPLDENGGDQEIYKLAEDEQWYQDTPNGLIIQMNTGEEYNPDRKLYRLNVDGTGREQVYPQQNAFSDKLDEVVYAPYDLKHFSRGGVIHYGAVSDQQQRTDNDKSLYKLDVNGRYTKLNQEYSRYAAYVSKDGKTVINNNYM